MDVNPNYNVDTLDANKTVDEDGTQHVDLYIASHGKAKRTGGPYLDDLEREKAEEIRAKMEGREPDYDNPGATAGTLLVPKSMLRETDTDKSHMNETVEVTNKPVESYTVPVVETKPDPTQLDWDNDNTKVAVLEAAQKFEELKAKAEAKSEPVDETEDDEEV